jgi:hypothetical protein
VKRAGSDVVGAPWAPYALAGVLLLIDYLLLSRGLSHVRAGFAYGPWALERGLYSDVLDLSLRHYLRVGAVIHPLPYVHDRIEYPVLIGFVLWLPSWVPGGPASWLAVAGLLNTAAAFGCIHLIRRLRPRSVWWIAASPALLLDAAINWDLIGIFFLVAAVVWFAEGRFGRSGAAAAVGVCFKLFPVAVFPAALAALGSRWWRSPSEGGRSLGRWLAPFAVVCGVVFLPFLAVAPSNTWWFVRFNDVRLQKDSVWGLLGNWLSTSVVSNPRVNTASLVVVVAAMAFAAWSVWRLPADHQARGVALATAVVVIVWMAVNKIWNPQYVLWVFAAGAFAGLPAWFGVALGAFSVYDWWFEFSLRLPSRPLAYQGVGQSAIIIRIVIFAAMVWWAVRELRRLVAQPVEVRLDRTAAPTAS